MSENEQQQIPVTYECVFSASDAHLLQLNVTKNGETVNFIEFKCREKMGTHQCDRRVVRMFERVMARLQSGEYKTASKSLFYQMKEQMYEMVDEYWSWDVEMRDYMDKSESAVK